MSMATAVSVMDPAPVVVKPTDLITKAIGYIMDNRYRNLPVVDDEGHYLGSFGVHCLLRNVLPKAAMIKQGLTSVSFVNETLHDLKNRLDGLEGKRIATCMNTEARTIPPDTSLVEALLILYNNRDSLAVVDPDSNKLLGVISYWDVGEKILSN
jgi:CBS-domain-containing membrane protein